MKIGLIGDGLTECRPGVSFVSFLQKSFHIMFLTILENLVKQLRVYIPVSPIPLYKQTMTLHSSGSA